ncbi:MAG: hypothetical protein HY814_00855 [Candidatus Riflebacteria bacterium]|nr:hypothetical protein [Candidatus Riflebacteria bacterium]
MRTSTAVGTTRPRRQPRAESSGRRPQRTNKSTERLACETDVTGGLCVTCDHAETCLYLRHRTAPVVFCEEFVARPGESRVVPAAGKDEAAAALPAESRTYRGLCATCLARGRCSFARPEEGVWHCEEFE